MKVRCLVCGETLRYKKDNPGILIDHLNQKHSGTEVFQYLTTHDKKDKDYLTNFPCTYCCKTGKPHLKKRGQDKGWFNDWFTMFWCWCCPLCCRSEVLSIYCSSCGKYGGSFDRATGKLTLDKHNWGPGNSGDHHKD